VKLGSLLPNSRFLVNTEMVFHYRPSVVRCRTLRRFPAFWLSPTLRGDHAENVTMPSDALMHPPHLA